MIHLLSPASAPRVLDDPVGHLLVEERVLMLTKSNNQDAVIDAWLAAGGFIMGSCRELSHLQGRTGTSMGGRHRPCRTAWR